MRTISQSWTILIKLNNRSVSVSDSKEEIMNATYAALCRHGYADLSIQNIADESDKGKSLIYYHYDDKEDLMKAFMDHLKKDIRVRQDKVRGKDPLDRLDFMLDMYLGIEDDDMWEFQKAIQEFRAQAQHNPDFRDKFREIDLMVKKDVVELMREAEACNPEMAAEMFLSLIEGSITRKVSTDDREDLAALKGEIKTASRSFLNK